MSKPLLLITGATGHVGFRTLVVALEHGYRARIALRKLEQAEKIKKTTSIQRHLDSVEFVHVPDITASNAYGEAIKNVEYVIHVASPIYSVFGPDELHKRDWKRLMYDPAKKGTTSILEAAAKEKSVKRVVITSSISALQTKGGDERAGPYDFHDLPDEATLDGLEMAAVAYGMSKLMAHRAGTEFMAEHKPSFSLIRVLPGLVQGANELYTSVDQMHDPSVLGSNVGTMLVVRGQSYGSAIPAEQVLLEDVAKAHVVALEEGKAKDGENLVIVGSGGTSTEWSDFVPIVEKLFPEAVAKGVLKPKAKDGSIIGHYDVTSSEKSLGWKFAGPEEMVKSVVGQYLTLLGEDLK